MKMTNEWQIRDGNKDDIPFIYRTWLKSYRYDSELGECRNSVFYPEYTRVLDYILTDPKVKIDVACKRDDNTILFGYAISEPEILHYVFVKQAFGRLGIARSLIENIGKLKYATHRTFSTQKALKKLDIDYNPFLLFKQGIYNGT